MRQTPLGVGNRFSAIIPLAWLNAILSENRLKIAANLQANRTSNGVKLALRT